MYSEVVDYRARTDDHLRALFIGGGGYTFPRYMETIYPGSNIYVIEIDPDVTEVAHRWLGLPQDTGIITFNQDARLFLSQKATHPYDLILGDAFNDFSVPYHLTTKEFNERVRAWLVDDGLYIVNIIDGVRGDFLRAYVYTLRQTFEHVYLAPAIDTWQASPRTTFVIIATDAPLELSAFKDIGGNDAVPLLAGQILSETQVDTLLAEGSTVLLTDRYAPVDQMLAPVIRGELTR